MKAQNTENDDQFLQYKTALLAIIHKEIPTCKVYLFGSRARGTHRSGADIDLALDTGAVIDFSVLCRLYDAIEQTSIPVTVDLVDLYSTSNALRDEVKNEGILWENCA